jgi:cytochrome b6-f complex iron-sulfur subunit
MTAYFAIHPTGPQWVLIGIGAAFALGGLGLAAVNVLAIMRPRSAGEKGAPRPLVGPPAQMTRRTFAGKMLGTSFGVAMLEAFGLGSLAFLWPNLAGGFGGIITLSASLDEIHEQIKTTKQPFYYAAGRFYLVEYDPANDKAGIYKDVLGGGLMALYQRCVHLGCRVPFCDVSQWFECPCHGSKYSRAGEYRLGPAPRGLDRFPIKVEGKVVHVDTGQVFTGPPRGTNTTGQNPEGPFCVAVGK